MTHSIKRTLTVSLLGLFFLDSAISQDARHLALESPLQSFVEDDFPFFTQTLDCRNMPGRLAER